MHILLDQNNFCVTLRNSQPKRKSIYTTSDSPERNCNHLFSTKAVPHSSVAKVLITVDLRPEQRAKIECEAAEDIVSLNRSTYLLVPYYLWNVQVSTHSERNKLARSWDISRKHEFFWNDQFSADSPPVIWDHRHSTLGSLGRVAVAKPSWPVSPDSGEVLRGWCNTSS